MTDRGPDSLEVIELMDRLAEEAPKAGGRVVSLLGNHEVMNLQGDLRYVAPGDVADFGSPAARAQAAQAAMLQMRRIVVADLEAAADAASS